MEITGQISEFLGLKTQPLLKTVAEALQLQYQDYYLKRENIINPIKELSNYIYKARINGLDKREQCSYAGSILVFSTLEEMGQKYASDVNKVNAVYLAGMKMAKEIWNKLDELEQSKSKVDFKDFEEIINQIAETTWLLIVSKSD
jgi:hypothetical protein